MTSSRVTAVTGTSPRSIRLAQPSASGPAPEPDQGRLPDQRVGHCQVQITKTGDVDPRCRTPIWDEAQTTACSALTRAVIAS